MEPMGLRQEENIELKFDEARESLDGLELGSADRLLADSWGEFEVLEPQGEAIVTEALEVLRDDLDAVDSALDSADGNEAFDLLYGGTVYWFSDDETGEDLAARCDRLRDFGLLEAVGLKPLPERVRHPDSSRKNTLWALKNPTQAKHALLRRYVDAWLPIMSSFNQRLVLVEGFAGPGRYTDDEPGSPLILLEAFLEHGSRETIRAELIYIFIEERLDRVEFLEAELSRLELPEQVNVNLVQGRYEEKLGELVDALGSDGKQLAPTFAFVDPFGYSHASMNLTGRFLQFKRCEVLIFVPLYNVNRFITREGQEEAMTALFGSEDAWKEVFDLHEDDDRLDFLKKLFQRQLEEECELRYVRSFEIQTGGTNSGYFLFFGTNDLKGLQKMKEAMWHVDPQAGERFVDRTDNDQMVLLEEETVDTGPLEAALRKRFRTEPFSIDQANEFTLIHTPFLPSHIKTRTLKPAEQAGRLIAINRDADRRAFTYAQPDLQVRFVD